MESNDSYFFKDKFPFKLRNSESLSYNNLTSGDSSSSSKLLVRNQTSNEVDYEPRRSKRIQTIRNFGDDFKTYNVEKDPKDLIEALSLVDTNLQQELLTTKWILFKQLMTFSRPTTYLQNNRMQMSSKEETQTLWNNR